VNGNRYASRKFLLVMLFSAVLIVGLFSGHIAGGEFISGMTILVGAYSAADVVQDHLARRSTESPEQPESPPLGIG